MRKAALALWLLAALAGCVSRREAAPPPPPPAAAVQQAPPASDAPWDQVVKVGKRYQVSGIWYEPRDDRRYEETGLASWYGPGFHGAMTANGETFDQFAVSAAHKTLPMPSYVEVENLENGRRLVVRVNDRGPFVDSRIIDLSRRSAELLGIERAGIARVRVRRITPSAQEVAALRPADAPAAPVALALAPTDAPPAAAIPAAPAAAIPSPPAAAIPAVPAAAIPAPPAAAPTAAPPPAVPAATVPAPIPPFVIPAKAGTQPGADPTGETRRPGPPSPPANIAPSPALAPVETAPPAAPAPADTVAAPPPAAAPVVLAAATLPPTPFDRNPERLPDVAEEPVAETAGMILPGAERIETVSIPAPEIAPREPGTMPPGSILIQVAAVADKARANRLAGNLSKIGPVRIETTPQGLYRVRLGPFPSQAAAATALSRVRAAGYQQAWIVSTPPTS